MLTTNDKMKKVSPPTEDLHFQQKLWINKLKYNKDQLDILQDKLDTLVKYYFSQEMMNMVEQFQNKFIVYRDVADRMIKEFKYLRNQTSQLDENIFNKELESKHNNMMNKAETYAGFITSLESDFFQFYTSIYSTDNHVPNRKVS
jgi:hypothetical protein